MRAVQALDFLAAEHEVTLLCPAAGRGPAAAAGRRAVPHRDLPAGRGAAALLRHGAHPRQEPAAAERALLPAGPGPRSSGELAPLADLGILQLVRLAVPPRGLRRHAAPRRPDRQPVAQLLAARRGRPDWLDAPAQGRGAPPGDRRAAPGRAGGRRAGGLRARPPGARQPPAAGPGGQGQRGAPGVRERRVEPAAPTATTLVARGRPRAGPGDDRQPRLLRQRRTPSPGGSREVWPALAPRPAGRPPGRGRRRPAGGRACAGRSRRPGVRLIESPPRPALDPRPGHPGARAHALRLGRADQGAGGLGGGRAGRRHSLGRGRAPPAARERTSASSASTRSSG